MNEWRSGLWQQALQSLGIEKPQMAEALQERFRAARLEHFALDTGVKVGRPWHAPPTQSLLLMSLQHYILQASQLVSSTAYEEPTKMGTQAMCIHSAL